MGKGHLPTRAALSFDRAVLAARRKRIGYDIRNALKEYELDGHTAPIVQMLAMIAQR
jgi:hypothetical protein